MSKQINIRTYEYGDAEKIYTLIDEYTPYQRDEEYWVWINRLLPIEPSIIIVAEYNNKVIGHYATLPLHMVYRDYKFRVGLGVHAIIHPEYRNEVSIFQLTRKAYKVCQKKNIDFIFGFPNKNYQLIQEKIEKWEKVKLFQTYCCEVNNINPSNNENIEYQLIDWKQDELHSVIYMVSDLIERGYKSSDYLHVEKDLHYFLNRYLLHPQSLYQFCWLKKKSNIEGWLVFKKFHGDEGIVKGHLVDFIASSAVDYSEVLHVVNRFFFENSKVDVISLWPINEEFREELETAGFQQDGFETYLGVKFLDNSIDQNVRKQILNFENWDLRMGDSDAF